MAKPHSKVVWDMAIEQFVTPQCRVCTNHSTVFIHIIPQCDVISRKIQNFSLSRE